MGTIATSVYKRLASLMAEKQGRLYSWTLLWLIYKMLTELFVMLQSAIMCIQGSRSFFPPNFSFATTESIDLAIHEGQVPAS